MISGELRFEGFDARSWTNLLSLFRPSILERIESEPLQSDDPQLEPGAPNAPQGTLVLVVDAQERLLKALHSTRGRLPRLVYTPGIDLAELAQEYRARRCVVLRDDAMDELAERLAQNLHRGDDYLTQWLVFARAFRGLREEGAIRVWPNALASVPIPHANTVYRAFDLLLPDETALLVMLWDDGAPWTSVALRRRAGAIDFVAGPDLVTKWTGPLGGDWRRDHRVVAQAVSRSLAPVRIGLFSEVRIMRALLRNPDGGAWARAVVVRDIVVHPSPRYVKVALTADAFRGVARMTARALGGLDVAELVSPWSVRLRSQVGELSSLTETLGFNPLRALATALDQEDPSE